MRGDSYTALTAYLESSGKSKLVMTFEEVKRVNGGYLPDSAYKHRLGGQTTLKVIHNPTPG